LLLDRVSIILDEIGKFVRGNLGVVIVVGAVVIGLALLFFHGDESTAIDVLQPTLDAASTQSNIYVPTVAANLTLTPQYYALTAAAPTISLAGRQEVVQYAASAVASSERDELTQAAVQASGPPNVEGCIDSPYAYASEPRITLPRITLLFPQLVTPSRLVIYQSFNPGFVSRVEATDLFGETHLVYQGAPALADCSNRELVIDILDAEFQTNAITIYIDQTASLSGPLQIDAVQLTGIKFN
jgi:hypothetical protein